MPTQSPSETPTSLPGPVLAPLEDAGAGSSGVAVLSEIDVALMMRQIRDAKSRIAEERVTANALVFQLDRERQMVEEHFEKQTKGDNDHIGFLEAQLTAHLLNRRAVDPSVKSIPTPWGVIASRVQQPEYVKDEAVLLAWAKGMAGLVRTKTTETVDWEGIKKMCHVRDGRLVDDLGEVIPGVEVIERGVKVSVEVFE